MIFIATFICCAILSYVLRDQILKHAMVFYAIATALIVVHLAHYFGIITMPRMLWRIMFEMVQECTLALALFMVVMFIGTFKADSTFGSRLRAIRGELSIIAWILTLGHVIIYFIALLPAITGASGTTSTNVYASFILAVLLLILLLLLGVTSFKFVKKRMQVSSWRKLQKLSYLFVALIYAHLLLLLLPSALNGGLAAQQSVLIYSLVFVGYAIARVVRWRLNAIPPESK